MTGLENTLEDNLTEENIKDLGFDPETLEPIDEEETIEDSEKDEEEVEVEAEVEEEEETEGSAEEKELTDEDLLNAAEKEGVAPDLTRVLRKNLEKTKKQALENERLNSQVNAILTKLQEKPAAIEEDVPDKEYEPDEYATHIAEKNAKDNADLRAQIAMQETMTKTRNHLANNEATINKPDYSTAKQFLLEQERNNIRKENPLMSNQQVESALDYTLANVVANLMNSGVDAAETIYNEAVKGGYRANTAPKVNIKKISENAAKSGSLGDSGGGSPKTTMTMENLMEMDGEDMSQFSTDYPDAFADIMSTGSTNKQLRKKRR